MVLIHPHTALDDDVEIVADRALLEDHLAGVHGLVYHVLADRVMNVVPVLLNQIVEELNVHGALFQEVYLLLHAPFRVLHEKRNEILKALLLIIGDYLVPRLLEQFFTLFQHGHDPD